MYLQFYKLSRRQRLSPLSENASKVNWLTYSWFTEITVNTILPLSGLETCLWTTDIINRVQNVGVWIWGLWVNKTGLVQYTVQHFIVFLLEIMLELFLTWLDWISTGLFNLDHGGFGWLTNIVWRIQYKCQTLLDVQQNRIFESSLV